MLAALMTPAYSSMAGDVHVHASMVLKWVGVNTQQNVPKVFLIIFCFFKSPFEGVNRTFVIVFFLERVPIVPMHELQIIKY